MKLKIVFFLSSRYTRECAALRSFRSPGKDFLDGCTSAGAAALSDGMGRVDVLWGGFSFTASKYSLGTVVDHVSYALVKSDA